jgi:uncharacterized protein
MPMPDTPDLARMSLTDVAQALAKKRLPPVEQWNPAHCGHSDMRIARDGTWYHQGSPIGRETMMRLFSSILRREEDGHYVLVTPAEKLDIDVEDVPFIAVELKSESEGKARRLAFRLNTGDLVVAGPANALRFAENADGPMPYLHVRGGMDARIARPVYYELANLALDEAADPLGLWSDGTFFPMAAA